MSTMKPDMALGQIDSVHARYGQRCWGLPKTFCDGLTHPRAYKVDATVMNAIEGHMRQLPKPYACSSGIVCRCHCSKTPRRLIFRHRHPSSTWQTIWDEADDLGWCIDTIGRGMSDRLHAHSCKPRGGDVQFRLSETTGQIASVAFEGKCMANLHPEDPV